MAKKGKLIVFEGADGSGKTTQAKLLLNYLKKNKIPNANISFPRYEKPWGKMVRRYLSGDFGSVGKVDPYLASMLYAGDRQEAAGQMEDWIDSGRAVVCNRYVGSSAAHMGAKLKSEAERLKFIKWLENLEYKENKIPREDLVILLHVPVAVSQKLMKDRKKDIHESDIKYLEEVVEVYKDVAKRKSNWVKVECAKNGEVLASREIHEKVLGVLRKRKAI